ncbi:MAG TPA: phytoene desaturase, partial [Cryomorphaceae bacterium]|nr:phytoene desaturase [Cryomorphaceae bacterium]
KGILSLDLLSNIRSSIKKVVKNPQLQQLLEFPVLFLGATPSNTPALYSLMNYADMALGTWYPQGGMYAVVEAFYALAKEQGAQFAFQQEVSGFAYNQGRITHVLMGDKELACDLVVASADYAHVDQKILAPGYRKYSASYWEKRKMAPSSFLYYIG